MSNLIIIKPRPKSRRFTNINGNMEKYNEATIDGRTQYRSLGTYNQERFPGSKQMERCVVWSQSLKKWLLKDYPVNSDELNKLAASCTLQYPDKHPKAGHYIETCDVNNPNDQFFMHNSLKITLSEGETVLNLDIPMNKIAYLGFLMNHKFQVSGEKINPAVSGRARYIITDKNIDTQAKKETRGKKQQAIKLYDALVKTPDKMKTVAMAMGLIKNEDTSVSLIEEVLWEAVEDDTNIYIDKMTKLEYFIKIATSDNEEMNLRNIMQKGIVKGHIKNTRDSGYTFMGVPVGKTKNNILEYFRDPQNSDAVFRLERLIDEIDD